MDLFEVFERFPTHRACIDHLEYVRWPEDRASCPHCGSLDVARKAENNRVGRWNCHACRSSFNVLSGTIFSKTKIPLQKWFLGLRLMIDAKKSLSSEQLARHLQLNPKSAWYMQVRIRAEMTNKQSHIVLRGIVEADETYVGGRPRKPNRREDDKGPKGRGPGGSTKTPIIGAVERGGEVVAKVASDLTGRGILRFLRQSVDITDSDLITDEYGAYRAVRSVMPHYTIPHSERFADGNIHTNTIEGFWSLLKRA